jgi:hypothetical protein
LLRFGAKTRSMHHEDVGSPDCTGVPGGALGTLAFASGETSKTISILIVDDAYVEGPESFNGPNINIGRAV